MVSRRCSRIGDQPGASVAAGGTTFEVRRMDPTVFPTIAYTLTSTKLSLVELSL